MPPSKPTNHDNAFVSGFQPSSVRYSARSKLSICFLARIDELRHCCPAGQTDGAVLPSAHKARRHQGAAGAEKSWNCGSKLESVTFKHCVGAWVPTGHASPAGHGATIDGDGQTNPAGHRFARAWPLAFETLNAQS